MCAMVRHARIGNTTKNPLALKSKFKIIIIRLIGAVKRSSQSISDEKLKL